MKPAEFVAALRKEIVDENNQIYKKLLEETHHSDATDEYWKALLAFYSSLDSEQKKLILLVMRQVAVDTLSNIFAILDGISTLEGQSKEFSLSCSGSLLNGSLQDIFLEMEE
jgi:hypothetical protein